MNTGKEFQILDVEMHKAREPKKRLCCETKSRRVEDECVDILCLPSASGCICITLQLVC